MYHMYVCIYIYIYIYLYSSIYLSMWSLMLIGEEIARDEKRRCRLALLAEVSGVTRRRSGFIACFKHTGV